MHVRVILWSPPKRPHLTPRQGEVEELTVVICKDHNSRSEVSSPV